jgi:hypothetical protein
VFEEDNRSRVVWVTDLLPDTVGADVRTRVEQGAKEMKRTLEASRYSQLERAAKVTTLDRYCRRLAL